MLSVHMLHGQHHESLDIINFVKILQCTDLRTV